MHEDLARFRAARDLLLQHRTDYDAAVASFQWPRLERFNWALDHFDTLARDNQATALWIGKDDGTQRRCRYHERRQRSNRLANWPGSPCVPRGARALLITGAEFALR